MQFYVRVLTQAMFIYPLIVLIVTIPYVIYNYFKYGSVWSIRIFVVYSFILYMLCVYCLVILPLPSAQEAAKLHGHKRELEALQFIPKIFQQVHIEKDDPRTWINLLKSPAFMTNLLNVFMTIPFGMYLHYYFKKGVVKTTIYSFFLSLFFELTQLSGLYFIYKGSYRLFAVDDLIFNTMGGFLGFFIVWPFMAFLPSREEIDATSYERGKSISLPRRLVSLMIDLGLLGVVVGVLRQFGIFISRVEFYGIVVLVYFSILPIFTRGRTIGKFLTKTRIRGKKKARALPWYSYFLRYGSLELIVFWIPNLLFYAMLYLAEREGVQDSVQFVLLCLLSGVYILYFFLAAIKVLMKKRLFYERWSKTKIVSTVEWDEEDEEE
ncbi:MAG: VanZ family protein [Lachnospiraceae bacterium]|jgi:putative membrane protein|nr:VanZ family protein [Lachnospiraceae bacterium]MBS4937393.1 VanZ family protein [Lachnospiraceae bacterium]